jgi:hypothetical protein
MPNARCWWCGIKAKRFQAKWVPVRVKKTRPKKERRSAVKNWWRKWSYEIPLAFGDALWDVLVVQFADFLSGLTVRRVLEFVAIALLVMAFIQTAPIDLAFLFAGDTLMYLEFVVIVRLAAGKAHVLHGLRLAARLVRFAARVASATIDRSITAINRRRERRSPARPAKPRLSDRSDDGGGCGAAWGALATA